MDPLSLLWLFFVLASLQPAVTRRFLLVQRRRALGEISREREVSIITLIHRQESLSPLGFPFVRYIDIETPRACCVPSGTRRPSAGSSHGAAGDR